MFKHGDNIYFVYGHWSKKTPSTVKIRRGYVGEVTEENGENVYALAIDECANAEFYRESVIEKMHEDGIVCYNLEELKEVVDVINKEIIEFYKNVYGENI